MNRSRWWMCAVIGCWMLGCGCGAQSGSAKNACGVAPVVARDSLPNIFSEQQEVWLGQVEADLVESGIRPMRDASLNAHIQTIVDRLLATLPPTRISFRVQLIDLDQVNGFSIAGGHIYITRKLAAAAHSDDELAGVLGHEIGHIISHQFAFETTRELKRLLGVTSLGDEADIRQKYEALLDAEYKEKHRGLSESDSAQAEADQIGIYAMAVAGYDPRAYSGFWDKVLFVQGKTGSRLGDLLGLTKPDQKRLRSMATMVAALPPGCGPIAKSDDPAFLAWHEAIVANQMGGAVETASGTTAALRDFKLTPPLHLTLQQLRFSPDGRFILGQDAASIFLLNREPLSVRYRIDAQNAMQANFSPDSQSITFSTLGLHTEQWSVMEKKLMAAHELLSSGGCYDARLAPDGRSMLCIEANGRIDGVGIALLSTEDSSTLWEKKTWLSPAYGLGQRLMLARALGLTTPYFGSSLSADGNVLVIGHGSWKLAFDLKERTALKIPGAIKEGNSSVYAFIGNDRIAVMNHSDPKKSNVFSFSDGKVLERVDMEFRGARTVARAGATARVLVYGLTGCSAGLADLSKSQFLMKSKTPALDEYDGWIAAESRGGAVVTGQLGDADASKQRHVMLPLSPLPFAPTAALSPDGRYLALSAGNVGGVWDATTGKQIGLVHGFSDAAWTDNTTLFLDTPKEDEVERHIEKMSIAAHSVTSLPYKVTEEAHMRLGQLSELKQDEKNNVWSLSMYDPSTHAVLWSKTFADSYFSYTSSYGSHDLIFDFDLDTHTAKDALKESTLLAAEASLVKDKRGARLIKILNGTSGENAGSLVVELPPNFAGTNGLNRCGDLLYVAGVDDRTSVYSIGTGKRLRDVIGYVAAIDTGTGRVFTSNRVGEGVVRDTQGMELAHFELDEPIRFAQFLEGANQMVILTADQRVRILSVGKGAGPQRAFR